MPDISKCQGGNCPFKENCYRYKSKAFMYQSYFTDIPYDKEKDVCKFFIQDIR
jgi:hypothetical protein